MKKIFFFLILSSSMVMFSKGPYDIEVLQLCMNDSVISHYIANYAQIDTSDFVLIGKENSYQYQNGKISLLSSESLIHKDNSGKIKTIETYAGFAVIKIIFPQSHLKIKTKLERSCTCQPWFFKRLSIIRKEAERKVFYWSNYDAKATPAH